MEGEDGELYHSRAVAMLQAVWGEGFLSPGGEQEVARLIGDVDLTGLAVLDIGCGAGGIDLALVRNHGAAYVTGIDVEDTVLACARKLVERASLSARIGVAKVAPGPLPFPPGSFDVVFSKDSIVHIPDKHALMREVYRVLRPGGRFIASDWLIGHDGPPSAEMAAYIEAEGLNFGMASPARYADALRGAGFTEIYDHQPQRLVSGCRSAGAGAPARAGRGGRRQRRRAGFRRPEHRDLDAHDPGAAQRRALPHAPAGAQTGLSVPGPAAAKDRSTACPARRADSREPGTAPCKPA